MTARLLQDSYLTTLATGCSVLPRQGCLCCGSLLFKGYAQMVEIKCRSCKAINLFEPDQARFYLVKPY